MKAQEHSEVAGSQFYWPACSSSFS